jgi:hypothetical protein
MDEIIKKIEEITSFQNECKKALDQGVVLSQDQARKLTACIRDVRDLRDSFIRNVVKNKTMTPLQLGLLFNLKVSRVSQIINAKP